MASIIFKQTDGTEITCELVAATIRFGKGEDNDIVLADGAISGQHGTISYEGDSFIITDLDSTNGTKINGVARTRHELKSRDRIEVGEVTGVFYADGDVPDASDFDPKVATSTVSVSAEEVAVASSSAVAPAVASGARPPKSGSSDSGVPKPVKGGASPYDEQSNTGFYLFVMSFMAVAVALVGLSARHYLETDGFFPKDAWEKLRVVETEGPLVDTDGNLVEEVDPEGGEKEE